MSPEWYNKVLEGHVLRQDTWSIRRLARFEFSSWVSPIFCIPSNYHNRPATPNTPLLLWPRVLCFNHPEHNFLFLFFSLLQSGGSFSARNCRLAKCFIACTFCGRFMIQKCPSVSSANLSLIWIWVSPPATLDHKSIPFFIRIYFLFWFPLTAGTSENYWFVFWLEVEDADFSYPCFELKS